MEFVGNVTYICTTPTRAIAFYCLFHTSKFLVRMMIKFRKTKEQGKEEDTIKRSQQNV